MITRVWRGWTAPEDAEAYQALLLSEVFPGIEGRKLSGYRGISMGRREVGQDVEFITIMWFDSLADVKSFSGENSEEAVVPLKARDLLLRFDPRAAHFETVVSPPQF